MADESSSSSSPMLLKGSITETVDIGNIESNFSTDPVGNSQQSCPVGQPGFWEGLIPVWGSGRAAIDDFQNGRWGWGLFNTAMAVSDVFLVKSLVTAGVKLVTKVAVKEVAEEGAKKLAQEAAEKAAKETAERTAQEAAEEAAAKRAIPKTYERPSGFRKGVRDQVWENAKGPDGKVRDPLTGREMKPDEPWDMGHKPGYEFRKHQQSAMERGISRKQFLDEYNNPEHYRPELPSSNRSHAGEDKTGAYFGD